MTLAAPRRRISVYFGRGPLGVIHKIIVEGSLHTVACGSREELRPMFRFPVDASCEAICDRCWPGRCSDSDWAG